VSSAERGGDGEYVEKGQKACMRVSSGEGGSAGEYVEKG
jgi:hypothetical protein